VARIAAFCALIAVAGVAAAASPPEAPPLGTLFHTPDERARLDRLRRGDAPEPDAPVAQREARTPAVTGYVRRSDGRNTVWVDGTPLTTRTDPRTFDPKTVAPKPPEKVPPKSASGSEKPAAGPRPVDAPPAAPAKVNEPAKR
jgi:hypothetical protein